MTGFEIKISISVHVIDWVDNNKLQQLGLYVWKKWLFSGEYICKDKGIDANVR